jgi:EAL domain-containing protein (putative c-di-GMP-specific phosphodiesterase class I)
MEFPKTLQEFQTSFPDEPACWEALREISPEFIKLDCAFVRAVVQDPAHRATLRAILAVADKSGALVIGEGLDTLEEFEMLGELGIHLGQGWMFGNPEPLCARQGTAAAHGAASRARAG